MRNSSACRGDTAVRILIRFDETSSNYERQALASSDIVEKRLLNVATKQQPLTEASNLTIYTPLLPIVFVHQTLIS